MRTTLNIEDELLAKAAELTGIKEKTSLVRLGLEALIARESARRLAALGGSRKEPGDDSPQKQQRGINLVLVDTSVWVAHLRQGAIGLEALLHGGRVVCHPCIVGELACGNLRNRSEIISCSRGFPEQSRRRMKK